MPKGIARDMIEEAMPSFRDADVFVQLVKWRFPDMGVPPKHPS
jgi:hypothetical protein